MLLSLKKSSVVTIIALLDSYFLQFCSDKKLRSFSSNKLRLNFSKNLTLQLRGLFFKIEFLIYGRTCPTALELKTYSRKPVLASKNIAEIRLIAEEIRAFELKKFEHSRIQSA